MAYIDLSMTVVWFA